jgi:hypothetical protein
MGVTGLHADSNPSASLGTQGDLDTDAAIAYFETVWKEDFVLLISKKANPQRLNFRALWTERRME